MKRKMKSTLFITIVINNGSFLIFFSFGDKKSIPNVINVPMNSHNLGGNFYISNVRRLWLKSDFTAENLGKCLRSE